jgi:hypothetical protein
MRIDFEQSGGFANVAFRLSLDLETLSATDAAALRDLVAASGVLEGGIADAKGGGGGLAYRLRLSDGPRTASWTGTDATLPEALAPLIDRLSELAVEAAKKRR